MTKHVQKTFRNTKQPSIVMRGFLSSCLVNKRCPLICSLGTSILLNSYCRRVFSIGQITRAHNFRGTAVTLSRTMLFGLFYSLSLERTYNVTNPHIPTGTYDGTFWNTSTNAVVAAHADGSASTWDATIFPHIFFQPQWLIGYSVTNHFAYKIFPTFV